MEDETKDLDGAEEMVSGENMATEDESEEAEVTE